MNSDRWSQVEAIFHAALERDPATRESFLADACAEDEALRREIDALLAHDQSGTDFIETPAIQVAARQLAREIHSEESTRKGVRSSNTPEDGQPFSERHPVGHVVGSFRIIKKIGEGGMGEVYLAEDVKLARRVALKLLPTALVSDARAARRVLREARAASALNHPHIVTIYAVEEVEGRSAIVMEYIDGESLRERLVSGPMPLLEVIAMGTHLAEAIGAAHSINIVHRDLKPANILFTAHGQVKIVDFGLAKAMQAERIAEGSAPMPLPNGGIDTQSMSSSLTGSISGTVPYMSPEQTWGEHLDARSDIFSLGSVLYEAATGRRPFSGDSYTETIAQIQNAQPQPPSKYQKGLPRRFDRIILRALAKEKDQRFASGAEFVTSLRRLNASQAVRRIVRRLRIPVGVGAILATALVSWNHRHESNLRWARQTVAQIPVLAKKEHFFEAYDLAEAVTPYIPHDATLEEWKPFVTDMLSVTTDPPGADVYIRRFQRDKSGDFAPPQFIGTTPIRKLEIARGDYLLTIKKEGYAPVQRSVSNALARLERGLWTPGALRKAELIPTGEGKYDLLADSYAPLEVDVPLIKLSSVPHRMVPVPGGDYQLVGGGRLADAPAHLDDYFIDRCEVSNLEFKEFVAAGGYDDQAYWTHPFIKDGRMLSWEEGLSLLKDRTNRPGPRSWTNQQFPAGTGNHPVTDICWYEAAAYAAFRGKTLPTVFQWEKAARDGSRTVLWGSVMPWGLVGLNPMLENRANFNSHGTVPVESFEFGASPYGCLHMAGNVAEWCRNARPNGFATTGGSWREGPNLFALYGQFPGFYSSDTLGFRCVINHPGATGDQGGTLLKDPEEVQHPEPASEREFQLMRTHYDYDAKPLNAQVLEDVETENWRRLRISYAGAAGQRTDDPIPESKRALAYLWLPKNASSPFQLVNYKPGGASYQGLTVPQETEVVCGPFILSGRAVFAAVLEGMRERDLPLDWQEPGPNSVAYREMIVQDCVDQRRGLDYLANREDIDMQKIVCMGLSLGAYDLVTMAVEDRFCATILLSAGIGARAKQIIAAANPVNFAPYIKGPKLMIHGRYDEGIPYETSAKPLFDLLSDPKRLVVLETGHFPPMSQWAPIAQAWLDETLGPVAK